MKAYNATIIINATPQKVWQVLTNVPGYPNWDPGMVRIEGHLALGETVKFFTKFSPEQAFAVKVTTFEPGHKMVFTGGLPLGLFKSERTHTLTTTQDGQTLFRTEEFFSGVLLPVFGKNIPDLTENFQVFANGLKRQAEKG